MAPNDEMIITMTYSESAITTNGGMGGGVSGGVPSSARGVPSSTGAVSDL